MNAARFTVIAGFLLAAATPALAQANCGASLLSAQETREKSAIESARTQAALEAVSAHWSLAEATGDTAYVNALLLPEYQSVNVDGTVHRKAAILAGALKRCGSDAGLRALEAWKKEHPHGTAVVISNDMAVISYYLPARGADLGVTSSDVLVYRDRAWHALYSGHTAAK